MVYFFFFSRQAYVHSTKSAYSMKEKPTYCYVWVNEKWEMYTERTNNPQSSSKYEDSKLIASLENPQCRYETTLLSKEELYTNAV